MKTRKKTCIVCAFFLIVLLTGMLSACGGSGDGDKTENDENVTVGIVNLVPVFDTLIDTYKAGMAELGYVEGENITYIYNGAVDDADAEVQNMVDAKVDLILSVGTRATLVAQQVTADTTIPVVFLPVIDPIAAGIVEDLSHPGGNVTGIMIGQSGPKQLEWLQTFVPSIKRVFLPYNSDDPGPSNTAQAVHSSGADLGIEVVLAGTPNRDALLVALQDMPEDIDAILVISDSVVGNLFADVLAAANERKIPTSGTAPEHATAGALLTMGANADEMSRQAARLCQQILKGTLAGDLPIELAEYSITINLQSAEALNITIPDSTLSLASELIR